MVGRVVLLLVLTVGALGQRCFLPDVPVQSNVDEARISGRWYEMRYIAATQEAYDDKYTDYIQEYHFDSSLLYDIGYWRWTERPEGKDTECDYYARTRTRVETGKYLFDGFYAKSQQKWVMETDYDNYLIEFMCVRTSEDGRYCEESTMQFWARQPQRINSDLFRRAMARFDEIYGARSCLRLDYTLNTEHLYPGVCGPKGPNYYVPNYHHTHGYMDPALIAAQKENLVAEKMKLVAEKEMLLLEKEQIRLQIDILRRRGYK